MELFIIIMSVLISIKPTTDLFSFDESEEWSKKVTYALIAATYWYFTATVIHMAIKYYS